jgi:hypothetical protein
LLDELCEFLYFVCRASHYDLAAPNVHNQVNT